MTLASVQQDMTASFMLTSAVVTLDAAETSHMNVAVAVKDLRVVMRSGDSGLRGTRA